jgi:GDP-L-fucose synthase
MAQSAISAVSRADRLQLNMNQQMTQFSLARKRVWVAGHRGMVGAALVRRLSSENCDILTVDRATLDLMQQEAVAAWMAKVRPQVIFVAAAKVGGILANDTYPADFLYQNLMIEANIIEAARRESAEKLLFLGSSCIYPREAPQPIPESALLTGSLEPTNQWYAIAKIAGIKLCQAYRRQYGCDFISAMPTNLYGPGDNYDLETSHVLPALIRKAHEAKLRGNRQIVIWGTGKPRRELLHVDDCADALVHILKTYSDPDHINVGSGQDLTISELARLVVEVVGFEGEIAHDLSKPDGTPRKLMSAEKLRALGWRPGVDLREGIAHAYRAFLDASAAAPSR